MALEGVSFTGSWPIVLFCVFLCTDLTFFYIMFPPIISYDQKELLDIRTAISLTFIWTRNLLQWVDGERHIDYSGPGLNHPWLEGGDSAIEARVRDTWREYLGEWINHHYPPFYWQTCNHWRINWMSSIQDDPINVIWRTVISYVCQSRG
jgi:hypothetical protein